MTEDEEDIALMKNEFSKKKKKQKKSVEVEKLEKESTDSIAGGTSISEGGKASPSPYSYQTMLDRVYEFLNKNNPEISNKKIYKLPPIQIIKNGPKKIIWVNFNEICKCMNRTVEHLFQYFLSELGAEGSLDEHVRFIIKGRFAPLYIESILRKYIQEYVLCTSCGSFNTRLTKDSISRLYFLFCNDCVCSKSVSNIKTGFHAQTRADRVALKNG